MEVYSPGRGKHSRSSNKRRPGEKATKPDKNGKTLHRISDMINNTISLKAAVLKALKPDIINHSHKSIKLLKGRAGGP